MQQGRKTGRWGGCLRGAGGGVSGLDQRPGTIKPETRDLQRVSVGKCCAYMIVFSNWWVVRGFQSQDINVVTFCLKTCD